MVEPAAPPPLPPLPTTDGDLAEIGKTLKRIEAGLTLLLNKVITMEQEKAAFVLEAKPIIDQAKAKFLDKSGKIKFWPFS